MEIIITETTWGEKGQFNVKEDGWVELIVPYLSKDDRERALDSAKKRLSELVDKAKSKKTVTIKSVTI